MATADELLMGAAVAKTNESGETTANEEILVADLNARVISIPASIKILGVESDDDVKRLRFKIPRHYGEFDLSTFDVRINFENAKGKGDVYPVDDLEIIEAEYITFTWLVDRVAFNYAGDVKFSICMKLFGANGIIVKELNTTYATLPVLEGLETEKALVEQNPSAFDQVMYRLYAVEAATGNGQNGYYSVVKVAQDDNGTLFTIVNQNGETIAFVRHGVDGYTPVKGVDYWTEDDKNEVMSSTLTHVQKYFDSSLPYTCKKFMIGVDRNGDIIDPQGGLLGGRVSVEGVVAGSPVFVVYDPANNLKRLNLGLEAYYHGNGYIGFRTTVEKIDQITNVDAYAILPCTSDVVTGMTVTDDGEGNVTIS